MSPATLPIRVLLVDDQPAILWGLEQLIAGESPRMSVIGKARDGVAALQLARAVQPDVILLDIDLAGESGLDFLPDLLHLCVARVLIFTGLQDPAIHARALRDGASAIVRKDESADALLHAIAGASTVAR